MAINLIYLFTILIGLFFGIITYIRTKNSIIIFGLGILLFSSILEMQWLNLGNYITDTTDTFRTIRDILRTLVTMFLFKQIFMVLRQNETQKYQNRTEKDQIETEKDQNKTEKDQIETEKDQNRTEKDQVETEKDQDKKSEQIKKIFNT